MQLVVDKLLTNYQEVGNGTQTILFLHGWADSSKTFEQLAAELKDFKSVLLDLPGFGATQAPKEAWGLHEYAEFVAEFLSKASIRPQIIIGHSNGGAIAIHGLANNMLQADKLILIASAGVRDPSLKKEALKILAKPAKLAIKAAPKPAQKRIKQKLYGAIGSDYLIAEHMQETFKKVVSTDVTQSASKLNMPICLIYGEKDAATPPAYGKKFNNAIKNSQLNIIPLAGHFVHHEQLPKVSRLIEEFIK